MGELRARDWYFGCGCIRNAHHVLPPLGSSSHSSPYHSLCSYASLAAVLLVQVRFSQGLDHLPQPSLCQRRRHCIPNHALHLSQAAKELVIVRETLQTSHFSDIVVATTVWVMIVLSAVGGQSMGKGIPFMREKEFWLSSLGHGIL